MKLTDQQHRMVEAVAEGGHIKGEALAGCGKTTSCKAMAERDLTKRFLYAAFNKANQREAEKKMPKNAECRTWHSLAYRATVSRGQVFDRDRLNGGGLFGLVRAVEEDKMVYPLVEANGGDRRAAAFVAVRTLVKFAQGDRPEPVAEDVPAAFGVSIKNKRDRREAVKLAAKAAKKLWEAVMAKGSDLPITHDFYLKAWALTEPQLPYDAILHDEAQDANPVTLALILAQAGVQQVHVGDRNQAIYGFRGSVNAMETAPGTVYPLTQSWRFGENIAAQANEVLALLGAQNPLIGSAPEAGVVLDEPTILGCDTVLCRGNAGVVREVVAAIESGVPVAVVGGTDEAVKTLYAAYDLWCDQKPKGHPELSMFEGWDELVEYADTDEGSSYRPIIRAVEDYRDGIPNLCRRLKYETVSEKEAELVVSTAHKAKGREWADVRLAEDFPALVEEETDKDGNVVSTELNREEARLMYVSITRATRRLNLSGNGYLIEQAARKLGTAPLSGARPVAAAAREPDSLFDL